MLISHAIGVSEGLAVTDGGYDAVCHAIGVSVRGPGCEGGRLMMLFAHAIGFSEGRRLRMLFAHAICVSEGLAVTEGELMMLFSHTIGVSQGLQLAMREGGL
jgi:hypothetical protein